MKGRPNPDTIIPNPKIPSLCYIKNVIKNPNIIVGDYTYYDDVNGAEQFTIAVGNPCRVIKKRFDDELIDLLLKLKWWDRSIEEIEELMPLLSCGDLQMVKKRLSGMLG